jgi:hypothetical protein
LPDAGWWEDLTSLSARRKWSQQRRKQRAETLRLLRRMRSAGMLGDSSRRQIVDPAVVITICSGIVDSRPRRVRRSSSTNSDIL